MFWLLSFYCIQGEIYLWLDTQLSCQPEPHPPLRMADLEAVLADVSYLMAMEKSKCTPAARASKKITLPDPRYCFYSHLFPDSRAACSGSLTSICFCSVRSVTQKYLEKMDEVTFDKIFNQRLGKSRFHLVHILALSDFVH